MFVDITEAVGVLTDLGVLPVIALSALIGIASSLYKRFRRA